MTVRVHARGHVPDHALHPARGIVREGATPPVPEDVRLDAIRRARTDVRVLARDVAPAAPLAVPVHAREVAIQDVPAVQDVARDALIPALAPVLEDAGVPVRVPAQVHAQGVALPVPGRVSKDAFRVVPGNARIVARLPA